MKTRFAHYTHHARRALFTGLFASLLAAPLIAPGAVTDLSDAPLSGATSAQIKPNVLFIMDDSYSMSWDYLPDWAGEIKYSASDIWGPAPYQSKNASFNGIAYNPDVVYVPPSFFDSNGVEDSSTYPSQTRANTSAWTQVSIDGYGVQSTAKTNLIGQAYYFVTEAGEFCTDMTLKDCGAADATHTVPAPLRWCKTEDDAKIAAPDLGACQAVMIEKKGAIVDYMRPRMPTPQITEISATGSGSTTVSSIKVSGQEILPAPVTAATPEDLIKFIRNGINACAFAFTGNCAIAGYSAVTKSASAIEIHAPDEVGNVAPVIQFSGGINLAYSNPFKGMNDVPGIVKKTVIIPEITSYPKALSRKDCVASSCTYDEEMTNYANWYAYYRTRMQTMKTATSRAFASIDDKYRIGYYSINNNTDQDFQNIKDFFATQKYGWYEKLFSATPFRVGDNADTPLRRALSDAGWLFAGKTYNGSGKLNNVPIVDPVQYYCQPNVTILSTDGYWNQGFFRSTPDLGGFRLDNKQLVGDQDGHDKKENTLDRKSLKDIDRPQLDGGSGKRQKVTEVLEKTLTPLRYTWFQDKKEQIKINTTVLKLSTQNVDKKRAGWLQTRVPTWSKEEYRLVKHTKTWNPWYHWTVTNAKEVYDRSTAPLNMKTTTQWEIVQKLETRSLTQPQFRTGKLKTKPQSLYNKATYKLKAKVEKVEKVTKDAFGNDNPPEIVDECQASVTTKTSCQLKTISDSEVSQCTHKPAGKTSGEGDTNYDLYKSGTTCYYDGPDTVNNVTSCTKNQERQPGPEFDRGTAIECTDLANNVWTENASSCDKSLQECDYNWGVGWQNVAPGSVCSATDPTKVANFSEATVTECDTGFTEWALADSTGCKIVTGSVECRYSPSTSPNYVKQKVSSCDATTLTGDGITFTQLVYRQCSTETGGGNGVSTCTAGKVNAVTTECSYGTWTETKDLDTCTGANTNQDGTPSAGGSVYSGPGVKCSKHWKDVKYEAVTCPVGQTCQDYSGWGGESLSYTNSCTVEAEPTGALTSTSRYVSACSYRSSANINSTAANKEDKISLATGCSQTTPSTPPGSITSTSPEYIRKCTKVWPNADLASSWTDVTSGTCQRDTLNSDGSENVNATADCRYAWNADSADLTSGEACPGLEQVDDKVTNLDAQGTFSILKPVRCELVYGAATEVSACPDPLPSYQKCESSPEIRKITTMPAAGENLEASPYTASNIQSWGVYDSTKPPSLQLDTKVPQAKETTPLPSNAGYCTAEANGVEKITYAIDPTHGLVRTTCKSFVPSKSDFFRVAARGPEIDGVKSEYKLTSSAPVPAEDCGKQADGSFVNVIEANAGNNYVRTICKPGYGNPTPNTLADVAQYFWNTDLRDNSLGNCTGGAVGDGGATNNVCSNTSRTAPWNWQNMRTFTLGLGASGVMQYREGYDSPALIDNSSIPAGSKGDYYAVLKELEADPDNGVCSWQTKASPCNWPTPGLDTSTNTAWQTNIDDLWHAAVNGRGQYFSAQNPGQVSASITAALQAVTLKEGGLSEPVLSDPNLAKGDVRGFVASFTAELWTGTLEMFNVSTTGKAVKPAVWSASIPGVGARTIYTQGASSDPNQLRSFEWSTLSTAEKKFFQKPHIASLSQLCTGGTICLDPATQSDSAIGEKLVNFLRGARDNEGPSNALDKLFRQRAGLLGDIVTSTPAYVQNASWLYTDNGYSQYRVDTADRAGRVYVGANDGMLHAFDAANGQEVWAYVPKFLMPDLFHLADKHYGSLHRFYVDGSPVAGDICVANCGSGETGAVWKTILVGGANAGGRGYYALDVTNPDSPKSLWEFTNDNLGFSYGNPIITKLGGSGQNAGKWVVIVASGYNNIEGNGDGVGRVFVLDPLDGSIIQTFESTAGTKETPSGLAKIAGLAKNLVYNNTVLQVYGADLLGNVWRFDINNDNATPPKGHLLAVLKDSANNPQPVTSVPELAYIKNKPVVFIGTGQLLGPSDLETTNKNTFYAIRDELDNTSYTDVRGSNLFVQQTMSAGVCPDDHPVCTAGDPIVTATKNAVDWPTKKGWYVDFPVGGERVNTTTRLVRGTLSITTNTPQSGACVPAGISFRYFLDYLTGGPVVDGDYVGEKLDDSMATGGSTALDVNGKPVTIGRVDGPSVDSVLDDEIPTKDPAAIMRRISWRELVIE